MINYNGTLQDNKQNLSINNRGYLYGDAVFETIKVYNNKLLFWEDHYFRLMASMRIMRMEIPMTFTLEYLQEEIFKTLNTNGLTKSAKVKLIINRESKGLYFPVNNEVSFVIITTKLENTLYNNSATKNYVVDLFKDYYVSPDLLSTIKSNNRLINIVGSIYAKENDFNNCLLLNTNKHVVEALNGNIFLVSGNTIKTPPLKDGCLKGVIRKQLIDSITKSEIYTIDEVSISPFEIQKSDELFITNVIVGIQPVTQYRKKQFNTSVSKALLKLLNATIFSLN